MLPESTRITFLHHAVEKVDDFLQVHVMDSVWHHKNGHARAYHMKATLGFSRMQHIEMT